MEESVGTKKTLRQVVKVNLPLPLFQASIKMLMISTQVFCLRTQLAKMLMLESQAPIQGIIS